MRQRPTYADIAVSIQSAKPEGRIYALSVDMLKPPSRWRHAKRVLIDALGNYLFFVPLVIMFTPALWGHQAAQYLIAAIPISFIGARVYTWFLKRVWYPLWKETF